MDYRIRCIYGEIDKNGGADRELTAVVLCGIEPEIRSQLCLKRQLVGIGMKMVLNIRV